jgi:hypothetical protein
VEAAIQDIQQALQEEKDASILRDPVRRALARARIQNDLEWLHASGVRTSGQSGWGADLVDTSMLKALRQDYLDWQFRLMRESSGLSSEASVVDLRYAKRRIWQIDAALDHRTFGWNPDGYPPPEDPIFVPRTPRPPPGPGGASTAMRVYEASMERNRLSAELFYLHQELDAPGPVVNVALKHQVEKTAAALKAEDARLAARARTLLAQAEDHLLQNGRGPEAAAEGQKLLKVRHALDAGQNPGEALVAVEDSPYLRSPSAAPATLRVLTENPRTGAPLPVQPRMMEIPVVRTSGRVPAAATRAIADFDELFPRTELPQHGWTRSFQGVMEDLQRAPGGVVIDTKLPASWQTRIQEAGVDITSGALTLRIGGQWRTVEPSVDPETARTAYAFVKDGRVMPMDLRNLNVGESIWLARQIVPAPDLGPSDWVTIEQALASFTAVNAHPAIRDMELALKMIRVDQFIFDLLPDQLDPSPLFGSSTRFGLNIAPLRTLYLEDFHNLSNPESWRSLFQKSILSVVGVSATAAEDRIRIEPELRFAIYRLPPAKNEGPAILLQKSTAWLQQNESQLRTRPVLDPLIRFAAAVALIRTVLDAKIPNNFDEMIGIPVSEAPTPRLLCRPEGRNPCGLDTLQTVLKK